MFGFWSTSMCQIELWIHSELPFGHSGNLNNWWKQSTADSAPFCTRNTIKQQWDWHSRKSAYPYTFTVTQHQMTKNTKKCISWKIKCTFDRFIVLLLSRLCSITPRWNKTETASKAWFHYQKHSTLYTYFERNTSGSKRASITRQKTQNYRLKWKEEKVQRKEKRD